MIQTSICIIQFFSWHPFSPFQNYLKTLLVKNRIAQGTKFHTKDRQHFQITWRVNLNCTAYHVKFISHALSLSNIFRIEGSTKLCCSWSQTIHFSVMDLPCPSNSYIPSSIRCHSSVVMFEGDWIINAVYFKTSGE